MAKFFYDHLNETYYLSQLDLLFATHFAFVKQHSMFNEKSKEGFKGIVHTKMTHHQAIQDILVFHQNRFGEM